MGDKILKNLWPPTTKRVALHTKPSINKEIYWQTLRNISRYDASETPKIAIRIQRLNNEWDTERVLEANAAILSIVTILLGIYINRWWFLLTGGIALFLLQHALQGWSPLLPIIRRMGVRTSEEIFKERSALKFLRGDFKVDPQELELFMERISE